MAEISKEIFEIVNKPGRVGVLSTANKRDSRMPPISVALG